MTGSTQDYRLTQIKNLDGSSVVISQNDYTYNAVGDIVSWQQQVSSGTPTIWNDVYDQVDQLVSAVKSNTSTSGILAQDVYGYDMSGNRTSEQIGLNVTSTSFNNLNQTTGAGGGGPLQFTGTLSKPGTVTVGGNAAQVDSSNNFRGTASVTTGTNTVAVVASNLGGYATTITYQVVVPPQSPTTPTYDVNGNLINNGHGQTYTWDAKNKLISITYTGGATTTFIYDGRERRVKIVEKNSGGTITSTKQFLWLGNRIAEERDASNAVQKRFFVQGEQIGGTNYYYTRDHLGSIRELTNSSGTIVARYDYDPFGRTTLVSGSNLSDFQYAGMYEHQPSGLNLTKGGYGDSTGRPYDPNTGRWLSRDPLKNAEMSQGPNLYEYVGNDPVDNIDPYGLRRQNPYGPPGNGCPCGYHPVPTWNPEGADNAATYMSGGFAGPGGGFYGLIATTAIGIASPPIGLGIAGTIILESAVAGIGSKCVPN